MQSDLAYVSVIVAAMLGLVVGYSLTPGGAPAAAPSDGGGAADGGAAPAGVKELTIEAGDQGFSPSSISVKKGDKVKLTVKNTGSQPIGFVIEGLDVEIGAPEGNGGGGSSGYGSGYGGGGGGEEPAGGIAPGSSEVVEFTATETGDFSFYCPQARDQGLEGTLTVEEGEALEEGAEEGTTQDSGSSGGGQGYGGGSSGYGGGSQGYGTQ